MSRYHAQCVGLADVALDRIPEYRCLACHLRVGVDLDCRSRHMADEVCLGRQPGVRAVRSLLDDARDGSFECSDEEASLALLLQGVEHWDDRATQAMAWIDEQLAASVSAGGPTSPSAGGGEPSGAPTPSSAGGGGAADVGTGDGGSSGSGSGSGSGSKPGADADEPRPFIDTLRTAGLSVGRVLAVLVEEGNKMEVKSSLLNKLSLAVWSHRALRLLTPPPALVEAKHHTAVFVWVVVVDDDDDVDGVDGDDDVVGACVRFWPGLGSF